MKNEKRNKKQETKKYTATEIYYIHTGILTCSLAYVRLLTRIYNSLNSPSLVTYHSCTAYPRPGQDDMELA